MQHTNSKNQHRHKPLGNTQVFAACNSDGQRFFGSSSLGANKKRFAQHLAALSDYLWRGSTAKETVRQDLTLLKNTISSHSLLKRFHLKSFRHLWILSIREIQKRWGWVSRCLGGCYSKLGGHDLPAKHNKEHWWTICFVRRNFPSQTSDLLLNGSPWIPLHNYLKRDLVLFFLSIIINTAWVQISSRLARAISLDLLSSLILWRLWLE